MQAGGPRGHAKESGFGDTVLRVFRTGRFPAADDGGSCQLTDICHMTGLSKQTVNSSIRGLEKDGTVRLEAIDAKSKKVVLTKQGDIFAEKTAGRLIKAENEILDSWSREEIRLYLELTERFLNTFKEKTEEL
jgi:DNA-binding MarR family transcriptional regulator